MLSNQDLNQNNICPLINNQIQNNTSQIINYYINCTQNLNMNNPNYSWMPQISLMENSHNLTSNNQNLSQMYANLALLNAFISMTNYINNFQTQSNQQQNAEMMTNCNNAMINQNEIKVKEVPNFCKKKRSRDYKNNDCNIKTAKNIKIINTEEKNGIIEKNKIEHSINNEMNKIDEQKQYGEKININFEPKSEKTENNDQKISETTTKIEKLNRKKKINKYKELLQDSILENLDNHINDVSIIINNTEYDENNHKSKNKNVNTKGKKVINSNKNKKNLNFKKKINSKDGKLSNEHNRRYNHHVTNKKNTKSNFIKYQSTKCIFHGDDYQKTKSAIDFMKYNYNYFEEKKEPTKINDADKQTVQLELSEIIYSNNYENNKNNLSDIKKIWPKSMN